MTAYGVGYLLCVSYHLIGDRRIAPYRMRRGGFAASSRHGQFDGTRGGTRGGKGRGEVMGGTKNGTTAIKQSSRVMCGGPGGAPTRDLRLAKPLFPRLNYWPVSVYI